MENLSYMMAPLFSSKLLIVLFFGTLFGLILGVLPGLGPTTGGALILPFTMTLDPLSAIVLLTAIYCAGTYGGAITAILINTPGTPAAAATCLDGYPLAQKGEAGRALGMATVSSTIGGIFSVIILVFFAPLLAKLAYEFGQPEYFALAIFGLTMLASIGEGSPVKNLIAAAFGILISTVGKDFMTSIDRFTYGINELSEGIGFIPVVVGLFAISEMLTQSTMLDQVFKRVALKAVKLPSLKDYKLTWKTILRSSGIGSFIGVLPAEGGTVSAMIGYNEARRWSKNKDNFGKGEPEGLIASETANNATVGGGFIPTLCLGIPGTPPDAVILGALLVQGIRTGDTLFTQQSSIVYTFIFGLLLATIMMLPLGLLMGRYAYKSIIKVPREILIPIIIFLTIIGSYSIQNNILNVYFMFFFGLIGWILNRAGFKASPIVLGLVLGQIAEQGFVQAYIIGNAQENILANYFARPISIALVFFIIMGLFLPTLKRIYNRRKNA